ncbi:MAG: pilus assembly protein PilM, partial [Bdellovibrionaceae bacterium]|nr:pilus assembly protein PilM [Pseudobdellovibrionaceae bacterium]
GLKGQNFQVALAIDQRKIAYRYKVFPFAEKNKILRALPFELEDELPYPIENAFCDARIIKIQGHQSHVLAAATPKVSVQKLMEAIKSLDLKVTRLTTPASALHNVVSTPGLPIPREPESDPTITPNSQTPKRLKIILDIGASHTIVNLYENDLLINSSAILWGTSSLVQAMCTRYEIDARDAEKILSEKGFVLLNSETANYDQIVFSSTLQKSIGELAQNLNLLIVNFESLHHGLIQEILITGGGSRLINLAPYLTQLTEIPTNILTYLNRFPGSAAIDPKEIGYFPVALGLALELTKKPIEPSWQFLQGPYALSNDFWKRLSERAKVPATAVAVLLVTLYIWTNLRENFANKILDHAEKNLKLAGENIAGLSKKNAKQSQIINYIKSSRATIKNRELYLKILEEPDPFFILNKISEVAPQRKDVRSYVSGVKILGKSVEMNINLEQQEKKEIWIESLKKISKANSLQELPGTTNNRLLVKFEFKGTP